jgi:hypothetical protein
VVFDSVVAGFTDIADHFDSAQTAKSLFIFII